MPIQVSAYIWLRNNHLTHLMDGAIFYHGAMNMPLDKREELRRVVEEIDELHKGSDIHHNAPDVIGPNVLISGGYPTIVERSYDPKESGRLFHEVHRIIRDAYVGVELYRSLGRAFAELNITEIDPELQTAINYGTKNFNLRANGHRGPYVHDQMCPRVVIESELRR